MPGAESAATGVSLTALTERVHSDRAIPLRRNYFLLMLVHSWGIPDFLRGPLLHDLLTLELESKRSNGFHIDMIILRLVPRQSLGLQPAQCIHHGFQHCMNQLSKQIT